MLVELGFGEGAKLVGEAHRRMIRTGPILSAVAAVVLAGASTGGGDVAGGAAPRESPAELRATALGAVDRVRDALGSAARDARDGAASTVSGDAVPGTSFRAAAAHVDEAAARIAGARAAVADLARVAGSRWPAGTPQLPSDDDLEALASELRGTAAVADEFAARRSSTARLLASVRDALSVATSEPAAARVALARARDDHEALVAWDTGSEALRVWLDATDAMIRAVERLIDATARGDHAAADAATADLAAVSERADEADRALEIAIAEGAAQLTERASVRLAAAVRAVAEVRAAITTSETP